MPEDRSRRAKPARNARLRRLRRQRQGQRWLHRVRQRRHWHRSTGPLETGTRADTLTLVRDRTHSSLHALVERYISSLDASQWPAPLRAQGERAVEAACQYGLGIIRMLAEYQVLEGIPDSECAQLAARLMAACSAAKNALARTESPTPPPAATKSKWRARHTWQQAPQAESMPCRTVHRAAPQSPTSAQVPMDGATAVAGAVVQSPSGRHCAHQGPRPGRHTRQ